jgi:two-component system sensor histidine kinase/response regulator
MPKVLLIEDDKTMLNLLKTLLDMEGFDVSILQECDRVLSTIKEEGPDLILMDVHLNQSGGEVSGFDLLRRIRQNGELKDTRVLMSSGIDFTYRCHQEGADGFILKPYMPDDLIAQIKQTLA